MINMTVSNLQKQIQNLISYACNRKLICQSDSIWAANLISDLFSFTPDFPWSFAENKTQNIFPDVLHYLADTAVKKRIINDTAWQKDQFENRIMNILTPRPSTVIQEFWNCFSLSPQSATDYFYRLEKNCYYIKTDRIAKNLVWKYRSRYGTMDITINLSKPEISKEEMIASRKASSFYPSDLLCHENEGYSGSVLHPSRMTLRQINLQLNQENWYMQYSPYAYFNEHCIVLTKQNRPMKIDRNTFSALLDYLDKFPHYFIGSNSDLPVCGGSILSHEHFQGGKHEFAMMRAPLRKEIHMKHFPSLKAGILNWPLSVLKLETDNKDLLVASCTEILKAWQSYNNEQLMIFSHKDNALMSTLTPVACYTNGKYIMYLAFRNSLTTDAYPLGYFHAHPQYHHIKKENIGLIEVMGLAILPPRLKTEMTAVKKALLTHTSLIDNPLTSIHAEWVSQWLPKYSAINEDTIDCILKKEIGKVFENVLKNCAVFPDTEDGENAFCSFLENI